MYKILTFVGTRPELIKMSRVIEIFDQFTKNILVHTGQNYDYELNKIFFDYNHNCFLNSKHDVMVQFVFQFHNY